MSTDAPSTDAAPPEAPPEATRESDATSSVRSIRKWFVLAVAIILGGFVLYEVINPYRNQPYEEIPHGDHVHYVPKDRNPDIPISQFPTTPPGPNERLTPDGQIVPAR